MALDAPAVAAWIARAVDLLLDEPGVDVVAVQTDGGDSGARERPPWAVRAFEALDRRLSGAPPDAFAPVDLGERLRALEVATSLEGAACDVVVDLRERGGAGGRPPAERVWRLVHQDGMPLQRPDPVLRALAAGVRTSAADLVERRPDGATSVLCRSPSTNWPRSLYRSRNAACWKAAHFPVRRLRAVLREGPDAPPAGAQEPHPEPPGPAGAPPPAPTVLGFLVRGVLAAVRARLADRRSPGRWYMAVGRRDAPGDLAERLRVSARAIRPPAGQEHADPFLLERDGRHHLFFEDFPAGAGRGTISRAEVRPDGSLGEIHPVLAEPWHLSYPFVFDSEGETYLMPESFEAGDVRLYRATAFPDGWELERVLLPDTPAIDATLLRHDDRWWLFAVVPVPGGSLADELSLFFADALEGPWTPHPRNPVVADARFSRPAGRIVRDGDRLVRPAQDCSGDYGVAVVLREIETLTTTEYAERTAGRIDPGWAPGNVRTHTYARDGAFEVVDGFRRGGAAG